MTTRIRTVHAWESLDSRGLPTVATRVALDGGASGTAMIPSGSTHAPGEAPESRDGGSRYGGSGVLGAVAAVNDAIGPAVIDLNAADQEEVDQAIEAADGSPDLSRLGSNATMAVSLAAAKAAAATHRKPLYRWLAQPREPLLPRPFVNLMFGDAHRHELQHMLCIPNRPTVSEALEMVWRIRHSLTLMLADNNGPGTIIGNSSAGQGTSLGSATAAFEAVMRACEQADLVPGEDLHVGYDLAAYRYWDGERYHLPYEGLDLTTDQLLDLQLDWAARYPVAAIEDPFDADDEIGWQRITKAVGNKTLIISDRLSATSAARLQRVAAGKLANAVLVKPNQAGTVTRTRRFVEAAQLSGLATVMGSRAGSTEDAWSADLCIAWGLGYLKAGATTGSDRTSKWNRVLEAESFGVTR